MQTGRPAAGLPAARGDCAVHARPRQTVRGPVPHAGRAGVRYSRDRGCPAYLDEAAQICAAESPFGRGGVGASTHARAGVEGAPCADLPWRALITLCMAQAVHGRLPIPGLRIVAARMTSGAH